MAADNALRQLLMEVAARLEGAVDDTCVPPLVGPPLMGAEGVPGGMGTEGGATPASAAAAHSAWREIKLLHNLCGWGELLAVAALQDLSSVLLADHVIPYLRAALCTAAPPWGLLSAAVSRVSACLPAAWRRATPAGDAPWSTPLRNFVVNEVVATFRRAHPAAALPAPAAAAASAFAEALSSLQDTEGSAALKAAYALS